MCKQVIVAALFATVVTTLAAADQTRRQGAPVGLHYDPTRETKVSGTIVRTYEGPFGELLILEIASQGKPLHLFLAPPEVVKKHAFTFAVGAEIEAIAVPGFKVNGGPAMLARQVMSGRRTLTLRDASGKPTWP